MTIARPIFINMSEVARRLTDPAVAGGITFGFVMTIMMLKSCSIG